MEEMVGNDLRNVNNEIEKLVTFVGEKKVIEVDDINQISGWVKTFHEWEMADSLEKADFGQSLVVLNNLFKESTKPEFIIGIMARFFRDILLAKLWLRDRMKDRRAIFKEFKPQIQEKYGKLYRDKYNVFFTLVDNLSIKELNHFLDELGKIDLKVKTSDVSAQALIEGFLFDYCGLRKKGGITWKERD